MKKILFILPSVLRAFMFGISLIIILHWIAFAVQLFKWGIGAFPTTIMVVISGIVMYGTIKLIIAGLQEIEDALYKEIEENNE